MFLMELEGRRGLLYLPGQRPRDRLSLFELADIATVKRKGGDFLLARLQEITGHIRGGTGNVALSGASIFSNAPNEAFDPEVTRWLDDFDKKWKRVGAKTRDEWNEALAKVGCLVTGQVEVYSSGAQVTSAVGLGGSEHVQRVLGDVYEQILAMVPKRTRKTIVLTAGKGGEKNERKALAAHYTPEGMVVEMVRPLVGVLFRNAWDQSGGDPSSYRDRLLDLRVVDPAMGSAHFLTVVALEIAKELAWLEAYDGPQPEANFEYLENPDPWAEASNVDELKRSLRRFLPEVVRRCCYGVDIKPLACELGKLALWLFTMTAEPDERPELTFVDGNIRTGDSLVGVTWPEAVEILRDRLDWDLTCADTLFGSELLNLRRELDEISREMRASSDDLRGWLEQQGENLAELPDDGHLLRCRALANLREKLSSIRWAYDLAVLAVWYSDGGSLLEALRGVGDGNRLPRSAERLHWGDLMMGQGAHSAKACTAARKAVGLLAQQHRAFHWELEFPDVMDGRRFDGVVANPPFRGDRDLRGVIGEDGVAYLRDRYTGTDTADYAGYFVLRYDQLVSKAGAFATLGPNTLAQAKNRRIVLVPLVAGAGQNGRFKILRAVRNRPWPGEAAVHVCMVHFVPKSNELPPRAVVPIYENEVLVRETVEYVDRISSYLDALAEADLVDLPSTSEGLVFNGMFPRGDFDRPLEFLSEVPAKERVALRSYLNNEDVQQNVEPHSTRVVIDFHDVLVSGGVVGDGARRQIAILRKRCPRLFNEVEVSVRPMRLALPASARNKKAREYWWRYEEARPGLRAAWGGLESVVMFGEVSKCWVPARIPRADPGTGLLVNPTHTLFVVAAAGGPTLGLITSFPFELHLRRSCSTLKSDLRVTPSEAFPSFPLPWPAVWSTENLRPVALPVPESYEQLLGAPMQAIVDLRKSILIGSDRTRIPADLQPGGPTDLYNLYDDPRVDLEVIRTLRSFHVALTDAVIRSYGWHEDGPDGSALKLEWGFDRPWIDGTTRFVPGVAGRTELILRIARRNARRFAEEMDLCLTHLLPMMATGIHESKIAAWRKEYGIGLSRDEILTMLDFGVTEKRLTVVESNGKRIWTPEQDTPALDGRAVDSDHRLGRAAGKTKSKRKSASRRKRTRP